jgi:WD40 repeat protein
MDGKLLVWKVAGPTAATQQLEIWELRDDQLRQHLSIPNLGLRSDAVLAPDGKTIAGDRLYGQLWDISAQPPRSRGFLKGKMTNEMRFSPDGKFLAQTQYSDATVWDLAGDAPKVLAKIEGLQMAWRASFSPDGHKLLIEAFGGPTMIYDSAGKKLRELELPARPISIAVAPDGRHLAVSNQNGTVYILRDVWPPQAGR